LVTVIEVKARIEPLKDELVPSVAELPTCQNMLQAWAPPTRLMLLALAVVRVDATWKMNTEAGSPFPSSVRVPLTAMGPVDL
jgi:hypothetical protein